MQDPLDWAIETAHVASSGLEDSRKANEAERKAVAKALELVSCDALEVATVITPLSDDRYHVTGTLKARIVQSCVVSLEPVPAVIDEAFAVTFWPADQMPPPAEGEVDIDAELDPEPIVDGRLAAGRVAFEILANAIDPYPRLPDAKLDTVAAGKGATPESSPFAALSKLKPKP